MKTNLPKVINKVPDYALFLRQTRESKRMKQEDIAKELGVSPMGLSFFETGKRIPKIEFIEKWANLLGYEVEINIIKQGK